MITIVLTLKRLGGSTILLKSFIVLYLLTISLNLPISLNRYWGSIIGKSASVPVNKIALSIFSFSNNFLTKSPTNVDLPPRLLARTTVILLVGIFLGSKYSISLIILLYF